MELYVNENSTKLATPNKSFLPSFSLDQPSRKWAEKDTRSPPHDTFYQRALLSYRIHLVHTWIRNSTRRREREREKGRGGSRWIRVTPGQEAVTPNPTQRHPSRTGSPFTLIPFLHPVDSQFPIVSTETPDSRVVSSLPRRTSWDKIRKRNSAKGVRATNNIYMSK